MSQVLHHTVSFEPDLAVRGGGLRLVLADGRTVIDASGGAAVACLGHGNARVAAAIGAQAARLGYARTGFFTSKPAEALAALLVGHVPGGLSHAFFVSSGFEAMEAALKLARHFHVKAGQPGRTHVISRRQSYHGNTLGAWRPAVTWPSAGPTNPCWPRGSARSRLASPTAAGPKGKPTAPRFRIWRPSWKRSSSVSGRTG